MAGTEVWSITKYKEYIKGKPSVIPKKKRVEAKQIGQIRMILQAKGVDFTEEYKFHPERKWRFDFAIIEKKIAIEYEGIYGGLKSRHTTVGGYTADTEKYNEAGKLGWKVLRYTAKTYQKLTNDLV